MSEVQIAFDICMVILWSITYLLVIFSTLKYKYPAIAPMFQMFVLPFEISFSLYLIIKTPNSLNYAFFSYVTWTLFSGISLIVTLVKKFYNVKQLVFYAIGFVIMLAAMLVFVTWFGHIFLFSYLNTFVGMVFWLVFIFKKDYKINIISLLIFISKSLADSFAIPVYLNFGSLFTDILCIALPILDIAFILVWIVKKVKLKNGSFEIKKQM